MDAWRPDLHPSRGHAQQCPLYALWILPPLSIALSLATDHCTPLSACVAALIVVAAILCRKQALARHWVPLISAVCLATTASLFVDLGRGTMLAAHAEIIYMLAMLLTVPFFDWRAIAVAAATCGLEWTGLDLFAASQSTAASIETMAASWLLLAVSASAMIWLAITGQSLASRAGLAFASSAKEAAELEASLRAMSEMASDLAGLATEERLARQFDQDVGASVTAALTAAEGVRIAVETVSAFAMHSARQTAFITDTSVETSVSASNLANSVEQMAVAVARATSEVRDVSTAAFKAMEDAGATNVTVQNLADSAEKIGEIVQMINDIAEQTNLLALNATIEAARAGEAGKGFSVVATEVKALARRTSRATQDIEKQISLIRVEMRTAMGAIDNIANTVAELGGITVSVAGTMEEQASRAQDIASHALSAATSVSEVAENLSDLANGAMRAETAAAHASSEADQLVNQCGNVKLTIEHFVQALVAA